MPKGIHWTKEEDNALLEEAGKYSRVFAGKPRMSRSSWQKVADALGRSYNSCRIRWYKIRPTPQAQQQPSQATWVNNDNIHDISWDTINTQIENLKEVVMKYIEGHARRILDENTQLREDNKEMAAALNNKELETRGFKERLSGIWEH